MINLNYSLTIEATDEPDFFGFFSKDIEGFSGIGHSIEDCIYKARWAMNEHVQTMIEHGLTPPQKNPDPTITVKNTPAEAIAG